MIVHLLTSAVARVASRSFCAGRSSLYSPMSVIDIVQMAGVSTVEVYIPSVLHQVQLARKATVRIGRSTNFPSSHLRRSSCIFNYSRRFGVFILGNIPPPY